MLASLGVIAIYKVFSIFKYHSNRKGQGGEVKRRGGRVEKQEKQKEKEKLLNKFVTSSLK